MSSERNFAFCSTVARSLGCILCLHLIGACSNVLAGLIMGTDAYTKQGLQALRARASTSRLDNGSGGRSALGQCRVASSPTASDVEPALELTIDTDNFFSNWATCLASCIWMGQSHFPCEMQHYGRRLQSRHTDPTRLGDSGVARYRQSNRCQGRCVWSVASGHRGRNLRKQVILRMG